MKTQTTNKEQQTRSEATKKHTCNKYSCLYHACMSDDCQFNVMNGPYLDWKRECQPVRDYFSSKSPEQRLKLKKAYEIDIQKCKEKNKKLNMAHMEKHWQNGLNILISVMLDNNEL